MAMAMAGQASARTAAEAHVGSAYEVDAGVSWSPRNGEPSYRISHIFPCPPCSTVTATVPFDGTSVRHHRAVSRITNGDIRTEYFEYFELEN